jgi:hypothetical protein
MLPKNSGRPVSDSQAAAFSSHGSLPSFLRALAHTLPDLLADFRAAPVKGLLIRRVVCASAIRKRVGTQAACPDPIKQAAGGERLSAPFGLPNAGAGSERTLAAPSTGSGRSRQAALTVGLLAAA